MVHLYRELERRERAKNIIQTGIIGTGSMGRGIAGMVQATKGMRPSLLVNRNLERAVQTYIDLGFDAGEIVRSDDPKALDDAVRAGIPAVTSDAELACTVPSLDVIVEATGTVEYAAQVSLAAIAAKKHLVVMNAEMDSTVGCVLAAKAREQGVIYSYADGDQPGVMMRMIEWVKGTGFEVVAAVNCKGYLNTRATPDDIRHYAERMKTSEAMVCNFTDGTKMNMENACVANGTGLVPEKRGMHGVTTNLKNCLADFEHALAGRGVVDYTLGGDFGGGILVIGRSENYDFVGHYLDYLKMGPGPNFLFFRPYHLCHVETPTTIAEAVVYNEATLTPLGAPIAEVIAMAKKDLNPGDMLDGIGGFTCYGEIDKVENSGGMLSMGLTENVRVTKPVRQGEPIPMDSVELDSENLVVRLREEQARMS